MPSSIKSGRVPITMPAISGMFKVFLGHLRAFEDLQLVELDRGQRQLGDDVGGIEHHSFALSGQTEDEMRPAGDAVVGSHADGLLRCSEVMPSVDTLEGLVVNALHAIFQYDIMRFLFLSEVLQNILINQVGPCAYNNASNLGNVQSLLVDAFQFLKRFVGIRKRLEISQVFVGTTVSSLVKFYAFLDLLLDGLLGPTI